METEEQGEAAKLEDAGGRERLLGWRRLDWRAMLLGWRRLVQEEAFKLEEAVDGEVELVGLKKTQNKVYGKTKSLLIGPDTTFIRNGSAFANRDKHYIY